MLRDGASAEVVAGTEIAALWCHRLMGHLVSMMFWRVGFYLGLLGDGSLDLGSYIFNTFFFFVYYVFLRHQASHNNLPALLLTIWRKTGA